MLCKNTKKGRVFFHNIFFSLYGSLTELSNFWDIWVFHLICPPVGLRIHHWNGSECFLQFYWDVIHCNVRLTEGHVSPHEVFNTLHRRIKFWLEQHWEKQSLKKPLQKPPSETPEKKYWIKFKSNVQEDCNKGNFLTSFSRLSNLQVVVVFALLLRLDVIWVQTVHWNINSAL